MIWRVSLDMKYIGTKTTALKNRLLLAGVLLMFAAPALALAIQLPAERTIGHIEAVFEFYAMMPTGVTVAHDGRI
ncbi:MAG: hypothetical protein ACREP6_00580, partial [Candidatus Binataceae bacterium]